ncbi:MAG: hypothetical protein ACM3X0_01095 [Bacteroidota bacterium]
MTYPEFFDAIPAIRLHDPLAELLGASDDGILEYRYLDAVKLAGHSCPTVAAAWNMTRLALAALYPDALPIRGDLRVALRGRDDEGVTGVIANVVSLITGAAAQGGFKGLGGQFSRQNLLRFTAEIPLELRFTRADTGQAVDVACAPGRIPADPEIPALLRQSLEAESTPDIRRRFGRLWQERVRCLLLAHGDDPNVFTVRIATD